jgi:cathepsin L
MGVGKITVKALSFPIAKGTVSIPVEVKTSALIPASLANVDVHIEATEQNGESVICLDVHTAKALESAHPSFEEWAEQYGFNGEDDAMRSKYNANLAEIDRLNAADNGATFAVNQFAGMTFEEFEATYLTNTEPEFHNVDPTKVPVTYLEEDPLAASVESIDWVSKGGVTPVKDQGGCGSCWAFSTMASVESVHKINSGQIANLAEQQLVDCNTGSNSGCQGGSATSALQWLVSNPACTSASYPYRAVQGSCTSCSAANVAVGGVNLVTSRSESALASALNGSPASVSVYADSAWQHYSSGVLQASATCSHNHAVLAVGYTEDSWKIKNSWGSSYGESGYIRIAKGLGGCGASGIVTSSPRIPTGVNLESVAV